MYVINIYLVSAPLRVFSGALMNCSKWMPKQMRLDHFFRAVTVWTYCSAYRCGQFIPSTWSRNRKSPSLHRCWPTAWNYQADYCSADRKRQRPCTVDTGTESSCKYGGALWLMEFATSRSVLNLARCAAGNQWRLSRIRLETGWNLGIRRTRRAAALRIRWTRSVCETATPDRSSVGVHIMYLLRLSHFIPIVLCFYDLFCALSCFICTQNCILIVTWNCDKVLK